MLRGDSDLRYSSVPLFGGPVGVQKQLWTVAIRTPFAHTFIAKLPHARRQAAEMFRARQSLFQALEQGHYSRNKESVLRSPVSLW